MKDAYYTLAEPAKGFYKEKGSKFIAHLAPIESEEEALLFLEDIKKQYYDARHHCYAWLLDPEGETFRANDDGEPAHSAGTPIYNQLRSSEVTEVMAIVVRYFGGTKLGVSGLIRAYKAATADALENATRKEVILTQPVSLHFSYELMSVVMRTVKAQNLNVTEQDFRESCRLVLAVRLSEIERVKNTFDEIYGVTCEVHEETHKN